MTFTECLRIWEIRYHLKIWKNFSPFASKWLTFLDWLIKIMTRRSTRLYKNWTSFGKSLNWRFKWSKMRNWKQKQICITRMQKNNWSQPITIKSNNLSGLLNWNLISMSIEFAANSIENAFHVRLSVFHVSFWEEFWRSLGLELKIQSWFILVPANLWWF